jgi:hypothetical protein
LRELYAGIQSQLDALIDIRRQMADLQDNRYEPNHRAIWEDLLRQEKAAAAKLIDP